MQINIKLPTKDRALVQRFLNDPQYIVESTWDKNKMQRVEQTNTSSTFLLQFLAIPIPGIDIVTPEIEVKFETIDDIIYMSSGKWSLKGVSGNILKDSGFMKSFDISLVGELRASLPDKAALNQLVNTEGFVVYKVQGNKPNAFKRAPAFILDGTINFIQKCVADFVNKRFSAKMTNAFREYKTDD